MGGRAASIISPDNAAFHSGNATGNARSIGLELRPEATDADYITAAAYIYYLRSIYGDVPLKKHSDWFATACPGKWDLNRLDAMARGVSALVPQSNPTPAPAPAPIANTGNNGHNPDTEIHWVVERGDSLSKIADYYFAEHSSDTINKIASYNGIANPNSIAVGQRIFIPGPVYWTVEGPDELVTIAAYYGMDADALAHNNGLPNRNAEIFVDQVLRII
jgi:N-acetylmuramoyl-L-alanine amidase